MLEPKYPHRAVWNLAALESSLGHSVAELNSICNRKQKFYYSWKQPKPTGGTRDVVAVREPLKSIQGKIKLSFIRKVQFPPYLQGSVYDPLEARWGLTNAKVHEGSAFVYTGDLKAFFDNVSASIIKRVWRSFFKFSPEIAELLTSITTLNDCLPQGASTSPGLANLVFFDEEHLLVEKLEQLGFRYSRFVDDVTLSSVNHVPKPSIAKAVSLVHQMVKCQGLWISRKKQHFSSDLEPESGRRKSMKITGFTVNQQVALPKERRRRIDVDLHKLAAEIGPEADILEIKKKLASLSSRVGQLKSLHPSHYERCKRKLRHIENWIHANR